MNELGREIKRYKLDDLLILLADQSKELFLNKLPFKEVEWKRYVAGFLQVFKQPFPAWGLADLSYLAIKLSNDYRSLKPKTDDIYKLNNLLVMTGDEEAKIKKIGISKEDMKTHILFGLSQKQFWYQEIIRATNIYYNFLRYYILLHEIPSLLPEHRLPDEDLLDITGFNINNFSQLLMAGYAYNYNSSSLINLKISDELKEKFSILTEDNLSKCLSFFIGDYSFYRKSGFPNNPLYLKPLIRTDNGKLIIIANAFIWARKLYEGIYWIIRNKHMENGSQYFINNFGEYYQRYIQELLGYYLKQSQYTRISDDGKKKKADWLIETGNYFLVVEQKSSLMTIALKEEYPSLGILDEYLTRNFKEAYIQIAETGKTIGNSNKTVIKLILHFEKFYLGEAIIRDRVNQLFKDSIDDLTNYFFIETEEFEKLIQILAEDEDTFNKVIETKLDYEDKAPIIEGIEFNSIINKVAPVSETKFLETRRHYFDSLLAI